MKRFVSILLSLIFVLSLASCTGIGDGALFRGEKSGDGLIDETARGNCKAEYYSADGVLITSFSLGKEDSDNIYTKLNTTPGDLNRITTMEIKPYFLLKFESEDDRVYSIERDDYVRIYDPYTGVVKQIGHIDGIYSEIGKLSNIIDFEGVKYGVSCRVYETLPVYSGRMPLDVTFSGSRASEILTLLTSRVYTSTDVEPDIEFSLSVHFEIEYLNDATVDIVIPQYTVYRNDIVEEHGAEGEYRYMEGIYSLIRQKAYAATANSPVSVIELSGGKDPQTGEIGEVTKYQVQGEQAEKIYSIVTAGTTGKVDPWPSDTPDRDLPGITIRFYTVNENGEMLTDVDPRFDGITEFVVNKYGYIYKGIAGDDSMKCIAVCIGSYEEILSIITAFGFEVALLG